MGASAAIALLQIIIIFFFFSIIELCTEVPSSIQNEKLLKILKHCSTDYFGRIIIWKPPTVD